MRQILHIYSCYDRKYSLCIAWKNLNFQDRYCWKQNNTKYNLLFNKLCIKFKLKQSHRFFNPSSFIFFVIFFIYTYSVFFVLKCLNGIKYNCIMFFHNFYLFNVFGYNRCTLDLIFWCKILFQNYLQIHIKYLTGLERSWGLHFMKRYVWRKMIENTFHITYTFNVVSNKLNIQF